MSFSKLVKEAFIDPLRSVLIVDDQYPTWEEVLNDRLDDASKDKILQARSDAKEWRENPTSPLQAIAQFRSNIPGFLVDIHDVVDISDPKQADRLHQSDLLVLDYNLEGDQSGLGGDKAREVLKSVLSNHHFNLIIVHTGEPDLLEVFSDCLLQLLTSWGNQFTADCLKKLIQLDDKLDVLESEGKFDRNLLLEKFGAIDYLNARQMSGDLSKACQKILNPDGDFLSLRDWGLDSGFETPKELMCFFCWAVREFESQKKSVFSSQQFEGLTWKNDGTCMWLRTAKGFVTFVQKGPPDLLAELQNALESWKPTPSRLISAKYRHQLSSVGVEAEDRTLSRSYVFAQFYKDFIAQTGGELDKEVGERLRSAKLKRYVSMQSEAISFVIEDEVAKFGEKIRKADVALPPDDFVSHYNLNLSGNNIDEAKKAIAHYNSYISTLPVKTGDDQLDSGHVFKLGDEWWVCATPACDLQPGQGITAFAGTNSSFRPFTALLLQPVSKMNAMTSEQINSGLYCYIEEEPGKVICLGLGKVVGNGKVNWRTFVSVGNGLISNKKLKLSIPDLDDEKPSFKDGEAMIVAKLRYEYALNYIQKVGTSVSRIGLGYIS